MDIEIFNYILKKNIIFSNSINNKGREFKIIDKITNINTKFSYYKYKLLHKDINILHLFTNSQFIYYKLIFFVNKILYKKARQYNTEDLLGNNIENDPNIFHIFSNKFIYNFTYNEFIKIIENSLFNFDSQNNSIENISNIFAMPLTIKNPYTNIAFKKHIFYNFYKYCEFKKYKIPTIYRLFYDVNFEIKDLFLLNENYITLNAIKKHINNISSSLKYDYLLKLVSIFCEFIIKHTNKYSIKYLTYSYKLKFYNLDINNINYYNHFIYIYFCMIYYIKTKQGRNYIHYKLKLVMDLLYDNNIKFIDREIDINMMEYIDITSHEIIDYLNNNLENIIKQEIAQNILIDSMGIYSENIISTSRENSYNNLREQNTDSEEHSEETSREQNEETTREQNEEISREDSEETSREQNEETSREQNEETSREIVAERINMRLLLTDQENGLYKEILDIINTNETLLCRLLFLNLNLLLNLYIFYKIYTHILENIV
jgi:hypothetical protein